MINYELFLISKGNPLSRLMKGTKNIMFCSRQQVFQNYCWKRTVNLLISG